MSAHTPTPWVIDPLYKAEVLTSDLRELVTCWSEECESNAEFIVRACNSHEALVEALRAVASLPGFEADEPYGVRVLSALALAEAK